MTTLTSKELLAYLIEDNVLTPEQLDRFIQANPEEDQYVDYKHGVITSQRERVKGRQTIREYTSGFANSDGGVLIIGVDENRPRKIVSCERLPGGAPLDQWVTRLLQDMVAYFSPQPRVRVVQHPQGHVLTIAIARAPAIVPCVEAKELKYFLRMGDSTLQAPDYLIADLVLGKRQRPLLELSPLPIAEKIQEFKPRDGADIIPCRSATFSFIVENLSLATAEDVQIGVVSWSLVDGETEEINRHLRSYLEICDIDIQITMSSQLRLVHRSSREGINTFHVPPFQKLTIPSIGPFYFHSHVAAKVVGAVYIIAKGAPPTWFQLEFNCLPGNMPTRSLSEHFKATLTRKGAERAQVALVTD